VSLAGDDEWQRVKQEISCARSVREVEGILFDHSGWYYGLQPRDRIRVNEEVRDLTRELPITK
jgi:hypothetical protein